METKNFRVNRENLKEPKSESQRVNPFCGDFTSEEKSRKHGTLTN